MHEILLRLLPTSLPLDAACRPDAPAPYTGVHMLEKCSNSPTLSRPVRP